MNDPVVGSATFILRATRKQMKEDLLQAERDLKGFVGGAEQTAGAGSSRIGGAISGLVGTVAATVTSLVTLLGLAAAGAFNLGVQGMRMADDLANSARRIGVGTNALQEWQHVAKQTGGTAADAQNALDKFATKLAQATAGTSKEAVKAFAMLQIGPDQLRSFKSTEQALDTVVDGIKALRAEADRSAVIEAMGLGPLSAALRDSAVDIAALRNEAHQLGIVIDQEMVKRASTAQGEFDTLSQVIDVQLKSAFIDLVPAIMTAVGWVAQLASALSSAMDAWRELDDRTTRGLKKEMERLTVENSQIQLRYGSPDEMRNREVDRPTVIGSSGGAAGVGGAMVVRSMQPRALETFENNNERIREINRILGERALAETPTRTDRPTGNTISLPPMGTRVDRSAEREARRAERVEQEIFRARQRMLGVVDDEVMTVQQRFDLARAQVLMEREAEKEQLESRLARKDITEEEYSQLRLIQQQTAIQEDRVAADILGRDLADERLAQERVLSGLTADLIILQAGAARTAKERRELELRLLAEAQRRAREDLTRDPDFLKLSPADQAKALDRQQEVFDAQGEAVKRNNLSPLDRWFDESLRGADEMDEAMQRVAANGLDALNQGLVDAILNARDLGDVFGSVAKQIVADLLQISLRQSIVEPLAERLFGGASTGKSVGKAVAQASSGSWWTKLTGFLGFANGGRVSGPGTDRSDSILARLSNGEFVVNAESTRRFLPLLEALNSKRFPAFADGSLVTGLATPDGDGKIVTIAGPAEVVL